MSKETVEALVDAGKASAGPPLGPALGPLGVNINNIIAKINEKTADFKGMKVPVKVTLDTETKEFEVKVGSPPTASLIKKELGVEKGGGTKTPIGDLKIEKIVAVAKMKRDSLLANDLKNAVKEVMGVCNSMSVTIEGKTAREAIKSVDAGEYDNRITE